jgi:hypothetical protein
MCFSVSHLRVCNQIKERLLLFNIVVGQECIVNARTLSTLVVKASACSRLLERIKDEDDAIDKKQKGAGQGGRTSMSKKSVGRVLEAAGSLGVGLECWSCLLSSTAAFSHSVAAFVFGLSGAAMPVARVETISSSEESSTSNG